MRIISCTGYYGTGSSAVTDYISEFSTCLSMTDYEFRFVHDPGGISDLEYHLVENHNRHNSGHALKRYLNYTKFLNGNFLIKKYNRYFGGSWARYSQQYVEDLTDFTFRGYWPWDVIDRGNTFYIVNRVINKLCRLYWRVTCPEDWRDKSFIELPKEVTLCSAPGEEKFLRLTRRYIHDLFASINTDNLPFVMVDQIVPPSNLSRYLRYFDDIRVIVVDRDPRDIFLLEKYCYRSRVIPLDSVEVFCRWFRYVRNDQKDPTDRVLHVQFEDMVYFYDQTMAKIRDWVGLDEQDHIKKRENFDPSSSIRNTRVWMKYPDHKAEVAYIEEHLSDYLYKKYEDIPSG